MLARLVKKGVLAFDQIGNSYLYRPLYTRDALAREATRTFVRRVFDGAFSPFLAQFAEQVDESQLKALKAELDRIEREKSQKRGK